MQPGQTAVVSPLEIVEPEWLDLINAYFESCKTTDQDKEDAEDA
jgi:hypothetical protein